MAFRNEENLYFDLRAQVKGTLAKRVEYTAQNESLVKELKELEDKEQKKRFEYNRAIQNSHLKQAKVADDSDRRNGDIISEDTHKKGGMQSRMQSVQ